MTLYIGKSAIQDSETANIWLFKTWSCVFQVKLYNCHILSPKKITCAEFHDYIIMLAFFRVTLRFFSNACNCSFCQPKWKLRPITISIMDRYLYIIIWSDIILTILDWLSHGCFPKKNNCCFSALNINHNLKFTQAKLESVLNFCVN